MRRVRPLAVVVAVMLLMSGGPGASGPVPDGHRGAAAAEAAGAPPPRKVALLVGIDNYPNLPARYQLDGPVNDAVLLARTLQLPKYGFRPGDIHLLVSPASGRPVPKSSADVHILPGQVTKRAFVDAFRKYLVADAHSGDILVFAYSGHGSLWEDPQEPSRRARTLIPTDSRVGSGTDILTVELAGLVTEALAHNPRSLTIVLDSCHAGSRARGVARARGIPPDRRPGVVAQYRKASGDARSRGGDAAFSADQSYFTSDRRYVLLAASREDQQALEAAPADDAPVDGVFTRFLVEALRSPSTTSRTTYREIMERVAVQVLGDTDGEQMPVLEGERDMGLFAGQIRDQRSFLAVARSSDPAAPVALPVGLAGGVTVGSVYDIYPRDDFAFTDPQRRLGAAQIVRATIDQAFARLLSGKAPPGAHAVERLHAQSIGLRVRLRAKDLPPAFVNALREALRALPVSSTLTGGSAYDVAVTDDPDRPGFVRAELADGEPLGGGFAVADPRAAASLVTNVARYAHVRAVTALENPASRLRFSATWTAATYDRAPVQWRNGYPVLRAVSETAGDEVAFTVANTAAQPQECPVYAVIVNIAPDGKIIVAPEHNDTGEMIEEIPWSGVRFRMVIPSGLPRFQRGREMFKVVVSTVPLNLRSLEQGGYLTSHFPAARRSALVGCADDWAVKDFVFWLDRAAR